MKAGKAILVVAALILLCGVSASKADSPQKENSGETSSFEMKELFEGTLDGTMPTFLNVGDVNNNRKNALVYDISNEENVSLRIVRFIEGEFERQREIPLKALEGMAVGDVDNDGKTEIVVVGASDYDSAKDDYKYYVEVINLQKKKGFKSKLYPLPGNAEGVVSIGDVDNDGRNELLVKTFRKSVGELTNEEGIAMLKWRKDRFITTEFPETHMNIPGISTADVDGDGKNEVLVAEYDDKDNHVLNVYRYDPESGALRNAGFKTFFLEEGSGIGIPAYPSIHTFKIKGSAVSVIVVNTAAQIRFLEPSRKKFVQLARPAVNAEGEDLIRDFGLGDVDNDGMPELVFGFSPDQFFVYTISPRFSLK